ncbi:MAG: N-methyl-L-tryptophan oxidase [Alphaproteobacteria bacterium]|nr:MAG: N-methyl-L-tryptophan oxidase [Alphaproteobacteria bacterium]
MSRREKRTTRRRVLQGLAAASLFGWKAGDAARRPARALSARTAGVDVAIIGAGVFGAWTAWHLARKGLSVVLVDAHGPANARASSGGENRVLRVAYGTARHYARWALESLRPWRELSERQSAPLFFPTGVLWLARERDAYIDDSLKTLAELGVRHEILDPSQLAQRWPQISLDGVGIGFLEHDGGGILARRAVQAVVREAQAAGASLRIAAARAPEPQAAGVRVPLGDDGEIIAERVVYACGPWLPKLFPGLIGNRILPTRQEVYFFGAAAGDRRFLPRQLPVWADFNEGDIFYGLPDLEGRGFKVAHHAFGEPIDPETADRRISPAGVREVRAFLRRRFPALAEAPLIGARVCQYSVRMNEDFLIDRHPHDPRVWLVGGGSGHGFKHGPALGSYLARLVAGEEKSPIPGRFRLSNG